LKDVNKQTRWKQVYRHSEIIIYYKDLIKRGPFPRSGFFSLVGI